MILSVFSKQKIIFLVFYFFAKTVFLYEPFSFVLFLFFNDKEND